jgi:hypothetical protein
MKKLLLVLVTAAAASGCVEMPYEPEAGTEQLSSPDPAKISITGTVIDTTGGVQKPVMDANVSLKRVEWFLFLPIPTETLVTTRTDANGWYSLAYGGAYFDTHLMITVSKGSHSMGMWPTRFGLGKTVDIIFTP